MTDKSKAVKITLRIENPDGTYHSEETIAPKGVADIVLDMVSNWTEDGKSNYNTFKEFEKSRKEWEKNDS